MNRPETYHKPQPGPLALLMALGCQEHLLDDAYQILAMRGLDMYDADAMLAHYRQAMRDAESIERV